MILPAARAGVNNTRDDAGEREYNDEKPTREKQEMDPLTESEKTFFESFVIVAKRPYLGFLAGAVLFFIGLAFYSKGMRQDQSGKILLAGIFFGWSLFEIIESYLAYRLYTIFEKMKSLGG
ncbi:MAG: hypothetical protein JSV28_04910 [Deltaproteobacteria bacterium]|nr:MAG: hypothetical protein JSV28_04910 [Deltaproteobacteria bacterium]